MGLSLRSRMTGDIARTFGVPNLISGAELEVHWVLRFAVPLSSPLEPCVAENFDNSWIHISSGALRIRFGIQIDCDAP